MQGTFVLGTGESFVARRFENEAKVMDMALASQLTNGEVPIIEDKLTILLINHKAWLSQVHKSQQLCFVFKTLSINSAQL